MPIKLIRVTVYEAEDGRRFVDVEGEHEPEFPISGEIEKSFDHTKIEGRAIKIPDLIEAGLLLPGDRLLWVRPQKGEEHHSEVVENGFVRLDDGRAFTSPSRAAMEAANLPTYDGWHAWRWPLSPRPSQDTQSGLGRVWATRD